MFFFWRPLAGREGRTVLCADIDQALAGLEAGQRLAAWEGGQGAAEAHQGRGVVRFWRGVTDKKNSQLKHVGCVYETTECYSYY